MDANQKCLINYYWLSVGLVQQYRTSESCTHRAVCTYSEALHQDIYWLLRRKIAGRMGDQKEHAFVAQMWRLVGTLQEKHEAMITLTLAQIHLSKALNL